jgi:hypothetical protein
LEAEADIEQHAAAAALDAQFGDFYSVAGKRLV